MATFTERYSRAYVFKDLDVEEPIDVAFHRRLAAVVTALLVETDVSPNQVTLASLAVGLWGSVFMYVGTFEAWFPEPLGMALAGLCLFASVILDCADGQLARARGGGSLAGRMLDGVVDTLVLCPAYVILGFVLGEHFGATWMWIGAYAGFTTWARCILYDKIKNVYLRKAVDDDPHGGVDERTAARRDLEDARLRGDRLAQFLLWFYVGYSTFQAWMSGTEADDQRTTATSRNSADRAFFRRRHLPTMRLAGWMGLGSHMFLIYTAVALSAVWIEALAGLQIVLATVGTAIMATVLMRFRAMVEAD